MLSDRLRTVAARLIRSEDTVIDGRMLLADAQEAALLESELAEIRESAGDVLLTLNEQTNALVALAERLSKKHPRPAVDGAVRAYRDGMCPRDGFPCESAGAGANCCDDPIRQ